MIPQSVAYAGLAGMPLVTGLYATFLPALVAVLFSASTRLSVGPSALTSVLVGASLVGLAEPGSGQWVALAVWLALLSGRCSWRWARARGLGAEPGEFAGAGRLQPGRGAADHRLAIAGAAGLHGAPGAACWARRISTSTALAYGLGSMAAVRAGQAIRAAAADGAAGAGRRGALSRGPAIRSMAR